MAHTVFRPNETWICFTCICNHVHGMLNKLIQLSYNNVLKQVTSVGNGIGPGTSAWRWHRYALVIPHWWRLTFTISGAGTRPSAHTAIVPTRRSSIWCSSVRPMITPWGTTGQETPSQPIRDASGATWNGLGWWPAPHRPGMRERAGF